MKLREMTEAVASQRRELPLGGKVPEDYVFEEIDVATRNLGTVRLSELFFAPMKGGHPRHVDLLWLLWNFFDSTPEGRGDFWPRLEY
jgi:predicted dithiol-disulfide oxidoreductase (DUF899 family)